MAALEAQKLTKKTPSVQNEICVIAWRCHRFKFPNSVVSQVNIRGFFPVSLPEFTENTRLKRVGARHSLFYAILNKISKSILLLMVWTFIPSYNSCIKCPNLWGHPNILLIFHRTSLHAMSKVLLQIYESCVEFVAFFMSLLTAKIMSIVPCFLWKPHWISGKRPKLFIKVDKCYLWGMLSCAHISWNRCVNHWKSLLPPFYRASLELHGLFHWKVG